MALVEYGSGSERFEGYFAYPEGAYPEGGARAPCVLIAHDWSRAGASSHGIADALSRAGYAAFAIDLYGKGKRGDSPASCAALMQPFLDDRSLVQRRFSLAIDVAKGDPRVDAGALSAIGHCFGGLCVLDMARIGSELRSVISVHGVLKSPAIKSGARITSRILILHGNEDPLAPPEDVRRARTSLLCGRQRREPDGHASDTSARWWSGRILSVASARSTRTPTAATFFLDISSSASPASRWPKPCALCSGWMI